MYPLTETEEYVYSVMDKLAAAKAPYRSKNKKYNGDKYNLTDAAQHVGGSTVSAPLMSHYILRSQLGNKAFIPGALSVPLIAMGHAPEGRRLRTLGHTLGKGAIGAAAGATAGGALGAGVGALTGRLMQKNKAGAISGAILGTLGGMGMGALSGGSYGTATGVRSGIDGRDFNDWSW